MPNTGKRASVALYADKTTCIYSKLKYLFLNNLQWCSDEFQKVIKMAGKKKEKWQKQTQIMFHYIV